MQKKVIPSKLISGKHQNRTCFIWTVNTQKLLGIQDLGIPFREDWLTYRKDKRNRLAKIIGGSLDKRPSYCPSCGLAWESTKDVCAHGTTPKKWQIQLTEVDNQPVVIRRFKCRPCFVVSFNYISKFWWG